MHGCVSHDVSVDGGDVHLIPTRPSLLPRETPSRPRRVAVTGSVGSRTDWQHMRLHRDPTCGRALAATVMVDTAVRRRETRIMETGCWVRRWDMEGEGSGSGTGGLNTKIWLATVPALLCILAAGRELDPE